MREARGFARNKYGSSQRLANDGGVHCFVFLLVCVCVWVDVIMVEHLFRSCLITAFNADGGNSSLDGLCARTYTNKTFSCWCFGKSFTVYRARYGNRFGHMAGAWLKKDTTNNRIMRFFF